MYPINIPTDLYFTAKITSRHDYYIWLPFLGVYKCIKKEREFRISLWYWPYEGLVVHWPSFSRQWKKDASTDNSELGWWTWGTSFPKRYLLSSKSRAQSTLVQHSLGTTNDSVAVGLGSDTSSKIKKVTVEINLSPRKVHLLAASKTEQNICTSTNVVVVFFFGHRPTHLFTTFKLHSVNSIYK